MALRIANNMRKGISSSTISGQTRIIGSTSSLMTARSISSTDVLAKAEKALENLQTNPYYEKYAKNIARLQETSPEEFLSRIEKSNKQLKEKRERERHFQEVSNAKPKPDEAAGHKKSTLNDIMKTELLVDKGKDEIVDIWLNYHKSRDCICGATDSRQFDKMIERSKKYPTFLLALPRDAGYEFIVSQFHNTEIHMTPLIWYQAHKENAPECLTVFHYSDLKENKDLVLMRGEFDSKCMTAREAQCLVNELQLYYCTDDDARIKLLETFTERPREFKHMDLVANIENIKMKGTEST